MKLDSSNSKRSPSLTSARARKYKLIAIGASAGGLAALSELLKPLPADMPGIVVVQHLDPAHKSHLAGLLARKTGRPVKEAEQGEAILPGTVYIGPPDEHLLVAKGHIQLQHSHLIHFSRPSIDLLFESAANGYGPQAIGVVLSGSNSDGATGIRAIQEAGGATLAQTPASAKFSIMPQAAIATGCVEFVGSIQAIGEALVRLCTGAYTAA
jgi:two-component system chemotaxis response regulator CheB